eukprot:c8070_g1_i1 orf=166-405(+)
MQSTRTILVMAIEAIRKSTITHREALRIQKCNHLAKASQHTQERCISKISEDVPSIIGYSPRKNATLNPLQARATLLNE